MKLSAAHTSNFSKSMPSRPSKSASEAAWFVPESSITRSSALASSRKRSDREKPAMESSSMHLDELLRRAFERESVVRTLDQVSKPAIGFYGICLRSDYLRTCCLRTCCGCVPLITQESQRYVFMALVCARHGLRTCCLDRDICIHTYNTYIYAHIFRCIHTCTQHTCMHAYIRIYIHTYRLMPSSNK
jgi:hypothetical protein